jgi:hypothetical protein
VPQPAIRHEIHEAFMTSPPPSSAGDTLSADHLLGLISAQIRPPRRVNTQVNGLHAVRARRVGPADDKSGRVARERLAAELAGARVKLDRQCKAVKATERRIADLTRKLGGPGGACPAGSST